MSDLFSLRLKRLRNERGETQDTVANFLKIRRSTYSGYERGVILPPYDKIQKLADRYDVSVDYLMGQTNFENYQFNNSNIPDVATQLMIISDELMSDTSAVDCNGKRMTNDEKKEVLPFVNNCIKAIEMISALRRNE